MVASYGLLLKLTYVKNKCGRLMVLLDFDVDASDLLFWGIFSELQAMLASVANSI